MARKQPSPRQGERSSARTRGGQPGNSNALRHGFYSRRFREMDRKDLEQVCVTIDEEVALLRVATRRMYEWADEVGERDLMEGIRAMSLVGNQVRTISGLLRTKAIAEGNADDGITRAAIEAIRRIQQTWMQP